MWCRVGTEGLGIEGIEGRGSGQCVPMGWMDEVVYIWGWYGLDIDIRIWNYFIISL